VALTVVDRAADPQDAERVFRGFAGSGHRLVFGTSFAHAAPITKVARQFPAVAFDNCAGMSLTANLGAFEARYYQGTYLAGISAAELSKSGQLGIVAAFPIPDIVGPANAFLLGAQSVRPAATCRIIFVNAWLDPAREADAARALIALGCDVLYAHTDNPAVAQTAEQASVWLVGYASDLRAYAPTRQLTSVLLDWSSIYVSEAEAVAQATWQPQSRWQGLTEGVVGLAPWADPVPAEVRALVASRRAAIVAGQTHPYAGEIRDQSDRVRVATGAVLPDGEIRGMDWLISGMQGQLRG
jgi:simple sugar transport system substrate-binding protein